MNRIPTLDGWRGIAVLLVLGLHYQLYFDHRFLLNPAAWFGEHGVSIFFVVSGYLITTNLLRNDDLKRFYVRRFFRLMPAAWAYLLTVEVVAATTHRVTIGNDLWAALLFFRNYLDPANPGAYTGHFWSLSIEEQFYYVWPMVLILFRRRAAWIAGAGALAVAVNRVIFHPDYMARGYDLHFTTGVRLDAIMVGCVLAFVMANVRAQQWITEHSAAIFWACVPVVAFDVWRYQAIPPLHENVAIALMVAATSVNPRLIASRVLEFSHLRTTGMLCYGIYLWQGLFFRAAFGQLGIALLPLAVLGSWVLIEKPCMRLGARLTSLRPSSSESADLPQPLPVVHA